MLSSFTGLSLFTVAVFVCSSWVSARMPSVASLYISTDLGFFVRMAGKSTFSFCSRSVTKSKVPELSLLCSTGILIVNQLYTHYVSFCSRQFPHSHLLIGFDSWIVDVLSFSGCSRDTCTATSPVNWQQVETFLRTPFSYSFWRTMKHPASMRDGITPRDCS